MYQPPTPIIKLTKEENNTYEYYNMIIKNPKQDPISGNYN